MSTKLFLDESIKSVNYNSRKRWNFSGIAFCMFKFYFLISGFPCFNIVSLFDDSRVHNSIHTQIHTLSSQFCFVSDKSNMQKLDSFNSILTGDATKIRVSLIRRLRNDILIYCNSLVFYSFIFPLNERMKVQAHRNGTIWELYSYMTASSTLLYKVCFSHLTPKRGEKTNENNNVHLAPIAMQEYLLCCWRFSCAHLQFCSWIE